MNPQFIKVEDKKYKINTSYKVALKCEEVCSNQNIKDYEKMLAVIYLLFGKEALKDRENYSKLFELSMKYLLCEEEMQENNEKPDMDFKQDFNLIKASFMCDYGIDLSKQDLDWYDFNTYLNGLTDTCILNKVRNIRTFDEKKITDKKERNNFVKLRKKFALKKEKQKPTQQQMESAKELLEKLNL